jgi:hypothetical protein
MDGQETLFTFGREQKQFDLPALNKVDHLVLIATGVNIRVPRDRHSARVQRLVPQRIAHLLFEPVCLKSLLIHDRDGYDAYNINIVSYGLRGRARSWLIHAQTAVADPP